MNHERTRAGALEDVAQNFFKWEIGRIDQFLRIIVGFALLAYTVKDGTLGQGWLGVGALGLVLVVTAFFSYSPIYTFLGINTRHQRSSA